MALRRFLGVPHRPGSSEGAGAGGETATVRRIVASLEAMAPEQARYLAGFAYVLSRAAQADLDISDVEAAEIERLVATEGGLSEAQAVIVVEIARLQARMYGETEDFLVTREWRRLATDEQALALLRCCYLVGAVQDGISAAESATLSQIASELGIDAPTAARVRAEFADRIAALRALRPPAPS
ncbi:MAG TPA: TerB family tellurite resistance protein [Candidatus Limnocylindrales bacterium]